MSERVLDIVDRLRGKYVLAVNDGAGLLNGKDTVTRDFGPMPPIWQEAAKVIEDLRAYIDGLHTVVLDAAPLTWAARGDMDAASAWEKRLTATLRVMTPSPPDPVTPKEAP